VEKGRKRKKNSGTVKKINQTGELSDIQQEFPFQQCQLVMAHQKPSLDRILPFVGCVWPGQCIQNF
jgi:hypothetical protein